MSTVLTQEMDGTVDTALPSATQIAAVTETEAVRKISPATSPGLSADVRQHLVGGTAALGLGVMLERGTGFLANILAARLGGASTFGAYSLAITTANNISTYAAGGIGATATRFSGKYNDSNHGYGTLARVLMLVSFLSATLAALALWVGAAPIAHLLHKDALTPLLRWAAVSAAGIILLECARGFFVGQRRLRALLLLSVLVGAGMVVILPLAARTHNPSHMITSQGLITAGAVLVCLMLASPLSLFAKQNGTSTRPFTAMLREVWAFGFVQLAGLVGSNLAGWWLTTLVARADTSLVQMSFFAIASQFRNLAGIAPGLLTEGSYAVMVDADGTKSSTPHRVMALCSFAALSVSFALAGAGIIAVPLLLFLLYGNAYRSASAAVAAGLAIAVAHMANAPAAARLSIVSIRATAVINTLWALFVAAAATLLLFRHGSAAQGLGILFAAHLLSAIAVLATLRRIDHLPAGMTVAYLLGTSAAAALAILAIFRSSSMAHNFAMSAVMLIIFAGSAALLFAIGKRHRWIPSPQATRGLMQSFTARFGRPSAPEVRHV